MNTLWQDLRYGGRMMVKAPGFTIVAVLSLALGIAVNTSVFTLVNAVLFKPMPVKQPEQLVALYTTAPNEIYPGAFSYPDYVDCHDHNQVFSDLFVHYTTTLSLKNRDGLAEMVSGELVTGNYFTGLRLDAALGRLLTPEDDKVPGAHPVAVLSYAFWQRRFGGDPSIVGQIVKLNGHDFNIIGVAKKGFSGTRLFGFIPEVYLPLMMFGQAVPGTRESFLTNRSDRSLNVNGRLKDGVSIEQAQAAMSVFARQLAQDHPQTSANLGIGMVRASSKTQPVITKLGYIPIVTGLMMGLVGLVLIVACANVANLLLARAAVRRREIAIRLALGARRLRLIQQLLTESVVLSVLGGTLGLMLATWLNELLKLGAPQLDFQTVDFDYDLSLDHRILGFTLLISVLTGIIFGLAPALQTSKPDLVPALKGEADFAVVRRRRFNLRHLLVVSQIALSLMLLVSAGLFVKSLQNVQQMNPGFRTDHILMASVDVNLQGYDEARSRRFYEQLVARLKTVPGVQQASLAAPLPLDAFARSSRVLIEGYVPKIENEHLNVFYSLVAHDYFETIGTPIVQGRAFTERDRTDTPLVIIINETMAHRYWPNQNPIGKRLQLGSAREPYLEVIGVAQDGKYMTLGEPPMDYMFLPFWQHYDGRMAMILRTAGNPETVAASIRQEVSQLDERLPVFGIRTMPQYLDRILSAPKSIATLVSIFGLLAMLLAAVGLYGTMSYTVAQHTHEIGIRLALGAEQGDVLRLIIKQGMKLTLIGVVLGVVAALVSTRLLAGLLYGVSATDPATFALIALLLTGVALLACYLPARRATKVDPMVALRYE